MPDRSTRHNPREKMASMVRSKRLRKLSGRRRRKHDIWFGIGLFGVIGWAVAIPTVLGVALGIWMDSRWPGPISWTLTFLLIGVVLGCLNAWYWITKERKAIEKERRS